MDTTQAQLANTSLVQRAAAAVAAVFLLVGVLGFVPGITTSYDDMTFAGHHSGAELLGLFDVSVLHNLVHLAFGAAGLVLARTWNGARAFLIGGGVIYLLLTVYGWVVDRHEDANFVPLDSADNWLHLALGAVMLALGLALGRPVSDPRGTPLH
ncbi:MAG TPA: DUF4383 domain-containing protein [Nocardioides sp.]|nr:DUF4383 domain-containing protein [Nocardioides sp.]